MTDTSLADGVADNIDRRVGPLPIWGWGLIILTGAGVVFFVNRRSQIESSRGTAPEPGASVGPRRAPLSEVLQTRTPPLPGSFPLPGGFIIGRGPTIATGNTGVQDGSAAAPTRPTNNQDWAVRASNYLIEQGFQGTVATRSVNRFVSGQALSPVQENAVNSAITGVGAPPSPVPSPPQQTNVSPQGSAGGGGTNQANVTVEPNTPTDPVPQPSFGSRIQSFFRGRIETQNRDIPEGGLRIPEVGPDGTVTVSAFRADNLDARLDAIEDRLGIVQPPPPSSS